jgi:hypothetical protein
MGARKGNHYYGQGPSGHYAKTAGPSEARAAIGNQWQQRGFPAWRQSSATATCSPPSIREPTPACRDPEIISRGFIYLREGEELIEMVKGTVQQTLESSRRSRNGKRRDMLQDNVSKVLYNETKRRPMVFSIINEN